MRRSRKWAFCNGKLFNNKTRTRIPEEQLQLPRSNKFGRRSKSYSAPSDSIVRRSRGVDADEPESDTDASAATDEDNIDMPADTRKRRRSQLLPMQRVHSPRQHACTANPRLAGIAPASGQCDGAQTPAGAATETSTVIAIV